jgi:hypothetical protein
VDKRRTGAELLKRQQDRKAEARRVEEAEKEAESQRRVDADRTEMLAAVEKVKSTWYESAVAASESASAAAGARLILAVAAYKDVASPWGS